MVRRRIKNLRIFQSAQPVYDKFIQSKPLLAFLSIFNWPRNKIRSLYEWAVGWAESKNATRALAGLSFAESSFFPIPPDPLLITMTTIKPNKYIKYAFICTVGSVLGGIFGYLIGIGLFEAVGKHIIDVYGLHEEFIAIGERYGSNAFIAIFAAAFTPIPYKLITVSAGVFHVNIVVFILASILGRGIRFFVVATLMHHFGKRYKDTISKYVDVLSLLFVILLILGIVAVKYVF